jgi:hypothetical protein
MLHISVEVYMRLKIFKNKFYANIFNSTTMKTLEKGYLMKKLDISLKVVMR